jgi:hypothetical protein
MHEIMRPAFTRWLVIINIGSMRIRIVCLVWLAVMLSGPPASAHAGGRAQLYVASATIAPAAGGWAATAVLRDLDSGAPAPGFGVEVQASGPAGASVAPVGLADEGDGRYDAPLPGLSEGSWAVTVRGFEVPGGNAALPVQRTWNISLRPGQSTDLARSRSSSGSGKGSGSNSVPRVLAIGAVAAGCGLAGLWFGRHRRAMVPVR